MNTNPKAESIAMLLASLGLGVRFEFVPLSQSRNAKSKFEPPQDGPRVQWQPSLNWRATVTHKGRDLFTTDYMQGCAHTPSHKAKGLGIPSSIAREGAILHECETGRAYRPAFSGTGGKLPEPAPADLFYSLTMDSDAIDSVFEDWALNLGFDPDSRKAEAIYKQCLDIAIRLRQAIGDDGLRQLREAFQDY